MKWAPQRAGGVVMRLVWPIVAVLEEHGLGRREVQHVAPELHVLLLAAAVDLQRVVAAAHNEVHVRSEARSVLAVVSARAVVRVEARRHPQRVRDCGHGRHVRKLVRVDCRAQAVCRIVVRVCKKDKEESRSEENAIEK